MKQALKQIIDITSQTHERPYTALSQIQDLALDAVRKDNKIKQSPSTLLVVGFVLGIYAVLALQILAHYGLLP